MQKLGYSGSSPVFSVIISCYHQNHFLKAAINSVLLQNYPAIQIIVADDASTNFDVEKVKQYIRVHALSNIVNYVVFSNRQNLGTVKNLNKAHGYCIGYYVLHFAADDTLFDETVLTKFSMALNNKEYNVIGIGARSLKCDEELNYIGEDYSPVELMEDMNALNSNEQFEKFALRCIFHMGSMSFIKRELDEFLPFDETYKLIEDWPFFLKCTRNGKVFRFKNFSALKYRAGGSTRPQKENFSTVRKEIFREHLDFHAKEIFPYSKRLSYKTLKELLNQYDTDRRYMQPIINSKTLFKRIGLLRYDWRYIKVIWKNMEEKEKNILIVYAVMIAMQLSLYIACIVILLDRHTLLALILIISGLEEYLRVRQILYKPFLEEYMNLKFYLFSPEKA